MFVRLYSLGSGIVSVMPGKILNSIKKSFQLIFRWDLPLTIYVLLYNSL